VYIIVTQKPQLSKSHLILKGGIYKVLREKRTSYRIRSYSTDTLVTIKKEYTKPIAGKPKLRFIHLAQVIKFLEIYKWHQYCDAPVKKFDGLLSIEEKMLSKFKYQSPFCHVFRKFKVDKENDIRYCFCPMKPYERKELAVTKNKTTGEKRKNCRMIKIDDGKQFIPEKDICKRIQEISLEEMVEMLKEIKIPESTLNLLRGFYFAYIWYKIKTEKLWF